MKGRLCIVRGLVTAGVMLSLLIGSGTAAGAAPASAGSASRTVVAAIPPPPDRCWATGTRIKSPSSSTVYLIGPEGVWYPFANEATYFNLFDSWAGLIVSTDFKCFDPATGSLNGAYLVKTNTSPTVYLYDNIRITYRPIPNEATFNYYRFSWSKIRVESTFIPPGALWTA